jgi:hypothetical protein
VEVVKRSIDLLALGLCNPAIWPCLLQAMLGVAPGRFECDEICDNNGRKVSRFCLPTRLLKKPATPLNINLLVAQSAGFFMLRSLRAGFGRCSGRPWPAAFEPVEAVWAMAAAEAIVGSFSLVRTAVLNVSVG